VLFGPTVAVSVSAPPSYRRRPHPHPGYSAPPPPGETDVSRHRCALAERLKARPGITHAAFSTGVPLISAGGYTSFNFSSPTRSGVEVQAESIRRVVTPDYFGALNVRIRSGRPFLVPIPRAQLARRRQPDRTCRCEKEQ